MGAGPRASGAWLLAGLGCPMLVFVSGKVNKAEIPVSDRRLLPVTASYCVVFVPSATARPWSQLVAAWKNAYLNSCKRRNDLRFQLLR
uniref:Putative secreted protein n=1 Tax=Amblyomma cajennense TaxID=34607 RepID=A0A023FDJ7_AMBCJ